jgi:hypothetical protein
MSESIPKEIVGIAYASEWDHIKQFIKALIELTLDSDEEYSVIVLNGIINNKKHEEFDVQIKSKAQIKLLTSITDFEKISFYQYSEYKRNFINVTKDKNVIVLTAHYMGPEIDHTNYFNFAIYLDSFDLPYFSDIKGNVYECNELMELIPKFKPQTPKKIKKPKLPEKVESYKSEVETYERLTDKNAIWRESETNAFKKWKMKVHKEFQEKIGGLPYYKGKVTKKYESYLTSLTEKPVIKKAPPKKSQTKKPVSKKIQSKKPIAKKSLPKSPVLKNKAPNKKKEPLKLETTTYNKLTGNNAIYGGRITKAFENWKLKMHKEFNQKVGGKPYYKGALTQKYKKYLNSK